MSSDWLAVVKADSARGLTSSTYSIALRCCFYSVYATATVVLGPASIVGRGRLSTPHFRVVLIKFKQHTLVFLINELDGINMEYTGSQH